MGDEGMRLDVEKSGSLLLHSLFSHPPTHISTYPHTHSTIIVYPNTSHVTYGTADYFSSIVITIIQDQFLKPFFFFFFSHRIPPPS